MPNQEPASVWIFGNGSVRVGTQGLFRPYLKTFVAPILSTRLTAPGSPRMCFHLPSCKSAGWICWNYRWECSQCRVRVRVTHRSWFTWSSSWRNVAGSSLRMIRENTRPSSLWWGFWGPKKTKCPAVRKFLEFLQKPFFLMVWKSK